MNTVMRLTGNIEKDCFNQLMDLCFPAASEFSLSIYLNEPHDTKYNELLSELEPYLVTALKTDAWFGIETSDEAALQINIYGKFQTHTPDGNRYLPEIFKKRYDNVFFNGRASDGGKNVIRGPRDICFFNCNRLFFGSVSHKELCIVYPIAQYMETEFPKLGKWERSDYFSNEQIFLTEAIKREAKTSAYDIKHRNIL